MSPRLDRLFSSLEAQFGAAVARAEEEAAADLALSLRQGLSLGETLATGAWTVTTPFGPRVVREVAKDHVRVAPGGEIVPLASAVFQRTEGSEALHTDHTLIQVLRDAVRGWRGIEIVLGHRTFVGTPVACGETHILVAGRSQEHLLPIGEICLIRPSREG